MLQAGAAPGCLLRGGKLSRYCCASPQKVAQRGWGGGGTLAHFFFRLQKNFNKNFQNGVGVVSSWPWLTAELTCKEKKKKKKSIRAFPRLVTLHFRGVLLLLDAIKKERQTPWPKGMVHVYTIGRLHYLTKAEITKPSNKLGLSGLLNFG